MLNSSYKKLCTVKLPFANRQKYAHTFDLSNPVMAEGFEDYLKPVLALCNAANAKEGTAYLTVDEKVIKVGESQRRPGPHIDGCFIPQLNRWGGGGGGWNNNTEFKRMPIIVASSVEGCKAWNGKFDAIPTEKGDLSHISDELGEGEILPINTGYLLSPECIHESMVFNREVYRTFMRIALPTSFDFDQISH